MSKALNAIAQVGLDSSAGSTSLSQPTQAQLRHRQGLMTRLTPTVQATEAIQPAKMSLG